MSTQSSDLVEQFYGTDPLVADDARAALARTHGAGAIELLVPVDGHPFGLSPAVEKRLAAIARDLGPAIVPHLVRVISSAPWSSKIVASPCFGGLERSGAVAAGLVGILEEGHNFDSERIAVEALGYLGADDWVSELWEYSRTGSWDRRFENDSERISQYPFEKLSSYVLEALARFAAGCRDRLGCDRLLRRLGEYLQFRERHLPNRTPDSYQLVQRHSGEFTEWSVDPLLGLWGQHADWHMQRLCVDILHDIAARRAAPFLLAATLDGSRNASVRRGASIALGGLRERQTAARVAATLGDPAADRSALDWAFSTLYAVPVDWPGASEYIDAVLAQGDEPSRQLRYSLALRGDDRCVPQLIDELDHAEPYHRWTAALALVRILGPGSRSYVDGRAEDAGDAVERCAMYAAQIRAGDHGKVRSLHEALQATALISVLRPVWKLEILDALRAPGDLDPRAFSLWRAAAGVGTRQLQYFDALSPPIADASAQTRTAPAPGAAPSRTTVFISYSRRDGDWLKRFQRMLSPLVRSNRIELWDDTAIQPGKWHPQIKAAMSQADVALFLVSEHFLASDFIMQNELPDLLQFAENGNVKILWVLVDDCLWEASALAGYQGENPEHPLSLLSGGEQTRVIKNACVKISSLMKKE